MNIANCANPNTIQKFENDCTKENATATPIPPKQSPREQIIRAFLNDEPTLSSKAPPVKVPNDPVKTVIAPKERSAFSDVTPNVSLPADGPQ